MRKLLKLNFFTKIVLLIVVMLIPIIVLYFYSNRTTKNVLGSELNKSNANQLAFFQSQVDTNLDIVASWPNLLSHDPDVQSFQDIYLQDHYLNLDQINLVKRIQNKLSLQESSSNWKSTLSVYSPSLNRLVTESDTSSYDQKALELLLGSGWQVEPYQSGEEKRFRFSWYTVSPFSSLSSPGEASLIVKVEFDSSNIQDILDRFKSDGRRDPFYYNPVYGEILNRSADKKLTSQLVKDLEDQSELLQGAENRTVRIEGQQYRVYIDRSAATGWYLIDYLPLSEIMKPISDSNRLFYTSVGALLLMSLMVAYILFSQVQLPLKQLVRGFQRLKTGDYTVRMNIKGDNEFGYVSLRFNSMVEQIQQLFENVFMEQLRVREARLKQLQSQINPHFFYNCFSFITSMAKLKRNDAVIAMSHSLSRYYRYTTRQERDLVSLAEELDFVTNYLEIQKMRMSRLSYDIRLPEELRKLSIPPLVIQPLVENAVLHGIEPHAEADRVEIMVSKHGGQIQVVVDDNGGKVTEDKLESMRESLRGPMSEEMGCGTWNVHQRLKLRFGEEAGLTFAESPLGGVRAVLFWSIKEEER
ncbi:sensor histidine kinase [Paenibacillus pinistramenti]|uniref:sensor histidine kinase n=1 Tax=Paenibacillus pinistramenti TaxID=1768003 RepID=UPI001EF09DA2|nr:histidine kinase [Paenibacillus pinistramenti]